MKKVYSWEELKGLKENGAKLERDYMNDTHAITSQGLIVRYGIKINGIEYQAIKYISYRFYNEMLKNNKHYNNIQDLFIYWLSGLALHTYYYTTDIINYLHGIGLYGKDEEQEQEKSAELYHYLIFREVAKGL